MEETDHGPLHILSLEPGRRAGRDGHDVQSGAENRLILPEGLPEEPFPSVSKDRPADPPRDADCQARVFQTVLEDVEPQELSMPAPALLVDPVDLFLTGDPLGSAKTLVHAPDLIGPSAPVQPGGPPVLEWRTVIGSVTVVKPGGLGDTILVLPALDRLRRGFPGARLTLVGSSWAEALRSLIPFPLEVVRFDGGPLLPLFDPSASEDPTGLFSGAFLTVLYTDTPEEPLALNARRFCRGEVILWPASPPPASHAADHFAAVVPGEGPARPTLVVPESRRSWGREWIKSRWGRGASPLAVHPGSGGRRKCWPAARFAEAALRWTGPVVLLEGPADREVVEEFMASVRGAPVERAVGLDLVSLGSLLSACSAFAGNDSGVSHLAAALGIPTVAVFGPSDPEVWAPRGPRVRVLGGSRRGGWPSVQELIEVLEVFRTAFSGTSRTGDG